MRGEVTDVQQPGVGSAAADGPDCREQQSSVQGCGQCNGCAAWQQLSWDAGMLGVLLHGKAIPCIIICCRCCLGCSSSCGKARAQCSCRHGGLKVMVWRLKERA
jgi:hypothetical protein